MFEIERLLHGLIGAWGPGVVIGYVAVLVMVFLALSRRPSDQAYHLSRAHPSREELGRSAGRAGSPDAAPPSAVSDSSKDMADRSPRRLRSSGAGLKAA